MLLIRFQLFFASTYTPGYDDTVRTAREGRGGKNSHGLNCRTGVFAGALCVVKRPSLETFRGRTTGRRAPCIPPTHRNRASAHRRPLRLMRAYTMLRTGSGW